MFKQYLKTLLLVCACIPCGLAAKVITQEEAAKIAAEFFKDSNVPRLSKPGALKPGKTSKKSDGTPAYYVFNAQDGRGFIIISADDKAIPVIGYSYDAAFAADKVSEVTTTVLEHAAEPVLGNLVGARGILPVAASTTTKELKTPSWAQESPFNAKIPNRRLVGCVGTAMAIVMKYHNHPKQGKGSLDDTSFDVTYDWTKMKDDYRSGYSEEEADAVSTLTAHCAISIKTDFGLSGSSAFEVRVPAALISYFGYDPGVSYKKRSETDRETWEKIITKEIDEGRPVIYSGQDMSSGHAFVCDGYEMNGSSPYFHINWGWGGIANGFFSPDALNPNGHNYNDQTTIIYNIKPTKDSTEWSPIHLTSDERQPGMTSDATDIEKNKTFTVRAGALKNVSYDTFSGKIAPALYTSDGKFKTLLMQNEGTNLTLQSMQVKTYADFSCTVPDTTVVADGDVVRMATKKNGGKWLPVAGDLITINEVKAKGNEIPYYKVEVPKSVTGATVTGEAQVIKGRDYSFNVSAESEDKVVTVKANGFILTAANGSNEYKIANVVSDQNISVVVQSAEDVVSKRSLWVTAGSLASLISDTEAGTIKDLSLYGTIDARDFTFMRDRMKLTSLDISNVTIAANGSNPANAIPANAFQNYYSLQHIDLPKNLATMKVACFNETGLTSIEIPASVSNYEYNVFLNSNQLKEVTVRRATPAWINWCVFTGTPLTKLVVPVGAKTAYEAKDNWKKFHEIVEENPTAPTSYKVVVQDMEGVKITPETESEDVSAGSTYSFTVETDDRFGDAKMEVHANATKLTADENGRYTAVINSNTLIHANFIQPTPVVGESPWQLTDSRGGTGIATDVVNVLAGKSFSMRVNALRIPQENALMYYAAVLTDEHNAIKEFISPIVSNAYNNYGDLPCTFNCLVKESEVREGNLLRVVTSYDMKDWYLVRSKDLKDSVKAVGNEVVYHKVTMPREVQGASIQGAMDQIVHGMDFSCKVTPVSVDDRITVTVNGEKKASLAKMANIKVESVREDLDIAIQVVEKNDTATATYNIYPGELASVLEKNGCPAQLKLTGEMNAADFRALQEYAKELTTLDLTDVTITPNNALPSYAFVSYAEYNNYSTLTQVRLPANLARIEANAFYGCRNIREITIPASVTYIGEKAFNSCNVLARIIALSKVPAELGGDPFPTDTKSITLEVPKGTKSVYMSKVYWKNLNCEEAKVYYNIQIDPERTFQYNTSQPLAKIEGPETGKTKTVQLGLPNLKPTKINSYKKNPISRPGVAFKLYDNKQDVTDQMSKLDSTNYFYSGGDYTVKFGGATDTTALNYPRNHTIDVVFYHDIRFNGLLDKAETAIVVTDSANVWENVPMDKFVEGSTETPTLYKEGESYRFSVKSKDSDLTPVVRVIAADSVAAPAVMAAANEDAGTGSGQTERGQLLAPDENGIYTISDLQSDVNVEITMGLSMEEDKAVNAENVPLIDDGETALLTELNVKGEMTDSTFACLREKFTSLESLDLSEVTNAEIADSALAGMKNLTSVTLPESVTSVGKDAFKGCTQLRSVFLASANTIGEGAFDGCSSLTSIMVCGENDTQTVMKRAPGTTGISDLSFAGINPNCIIYLSKGLEDGISDKTNVVLNGDDKCEALTDIIFTDTCALNIPSGFNLGDKQVSLTASLEYPSQDGESAGWKGIVLPFDPSQIKDGTGTEYTMASSGRRTISARSFNEDGVRLEDQSSIEANKPYLIHLNEPTDGSVELTFSASSVPGSSSESVPGVYDLPGTPETEALTKAGKDYSLYGNYAPTTADTTMYVLDAEGRRFVRFTAEDGPLALAPVSVYAKANSAATDDSFEIGSIKATGIDGHYQKGRGLRIYKNGNGLVIRSDEAREIGIFTASGVQVRVLTLTKGLNTISLAPGIYVVDGVKVIL